MKIKETMLGIILSSTMAVAPVMAQVGTSTQPSVGSESDLAFAFASADNVQYSLMTSEEMDETEGAWVWFAVRVVWGVFGPLTMRKAY